MLDAEQRVAVVARVVVDSTTTTSGLSDLIEALLGQGAVGVSLQCAGSAGGEPIPAELIAAAAALTEVTVDVEGLDQAVQALRAGASGLLVGKAVDPDVRVLAAAHRARIWFRAVPVPPAQGPAGERLVLEYDVPAVSPLAARLDSSGSPKSIEAERLVACALPDRGSLPGGALEALTTVAVVGGARILRCHGAEDGDDVRVVRRCADVTMELLAAGEALGAESLDPQVAS